MKIGVTGISGMVGSRILEMIPDTHPIAVDVTNRIALRRELDAINPDIIIHCAAKTDVNWCQDHPKEAFYANVWGTDTLVSNFNGKIIYISTDHIFDGKKLWWSGYSERHDANPINSYGMSKLAGEYMVLTRLHFEKATRIIRTSTLFNFDYAVSKLDGTPKEFSNLLLRSFLHLDHFIHGLQYVIDHWNKLPPILNISGSYRMSRYDFFSAVAQHFAIPKSYIISRNKELKNEVPRPLRAGLNISLARKLGVPTYSAYDGIKLL